MRSSKRWIEKEEGKNKIVWKETWKNIGNFKEGNCTDKGKNRDWIFRVKCLNEALPTMDKLNKRNPDLYESSICIACGAEEETQDHLATCQGYQASWNRTEEEVSEAIRKEVLDDTNNLEEARESIREEVFGTNQREKFEAREELMRGLLSTKRKGKLENFAQNGKKKTKLAGALLDSFSEIFRKRIWSQRCDLVADWEKDHGIERSDKRRKMSGKKKTKRNKIGPNKENVNPSTSKSNKEEHSAKRLEGRKDKGKGKSKLDVKLKELFENNVKAWIGENVKPAWSSWTKPVRKNSRQS